MVDRINKRKLKARRDGKIGLVHSSLTPPDEEDSGGGTESERQLMANTELLQNQIEQKGKQIERQQIIMMELSRDIELQQKLIEYRGSPWWSRWFKKLRSSNDESDGRVQ